MGQTITITTILHEVPKRLPGLSSAAVLGAGGANLSAVATSPETLAALQLIWNTAVSRTMILSVTLVAASVPFTLGMEWLNAKTVAASRKQSAEMEMSTREGEA